MRAVVQRVERAAVRVGNDTVSVIGKGLLVLLGVGRDDSEADARYVSDKVGTLRIFEDSEGKMNLSVRDVGGCVMIVSQFTLFGDCRKGRRPSFTEAASPEKAQVLYGLVIELLTQSGLPTVEGVFQASMQVELVNDGPVTILLDSRKQF